MITLKKIAEITKNLYTRNHRDGKQKAKGQLPVYSLSRRKPVSSIITKRMQGMDS